MHACDPKGKHHSCTTKSVSFVKIKWKEKDLQ